MARRILVVEDDRNISELLQMYLEKEGFETSVAKDGSRGMEQFRTFQPDLVLLDIMMPVMDGWTVLRKIRETDATPVIMLTAKGELEDRVTGLDTGANDYLPKPFDTRELLARLRVLTRQQNQQSSTIRTGNIALDTVTFSVSGPHGTQTLVNKEYQVLLLLMQNPGQIISADRFLETVWEPDSLGQENALWTVIYNLRKKLSDLGADVQIKTKRHLGYTLENCL